MDSRERSRRFEQPRSGRQFSDIVRDYPRLIYGIPIPELTIHHVGAEMIAWPRLMRSRRLAGAGYAGLGLLALALLGLLVTTALTAWQAASAAKAARQALAKGLDHLSSVAAWELSRRASSELERAVRMTTWPVTQLPSGSALPNASDAFTGRAMKCKCDPPLHGASYARVDLDGTVRATLTGPDWVSGDAADLERLAPTLGGHTTPPPMPGMGPAPRLVVLRSGDGGRLRLMVSQIVVGTDGAARALFAMLVDSVSLTNVLTHGLATTAYLPGAITRGVASDSLLGLTIATASGRGVYERPLHGGSSGVSGVDSLGGVAVGLVARVELSKRAAALVSESAATGARTPLAIPWALFALTVILSAVCAWELRRHLALSRLRSEFVASVSHDLHTPLALVTSYAETLLLDRAHDDAERKRFAGVILREARRLTRLVENVLRFVGVRRDAVACMPSPVLLGDLVEEACRDYAPFADLRSATVDAEVENNVEVLADQDALRQILFNVLDNAVRYGPPGQTIHVTVRQDDGRALLTVDDEGDALPARDRDRAFEKFTRLASALGPEAKSGCGIGLSVVRSLAEQHGGRAFLAESPTGGTRFVLELPLAPNAASEQSKPVTDEIAELVP